MASGQDSVSFLPPYKSKQNGSRLQPDSVSQVLLITNRLLMGGIHRNSR
jgi:hypothetical protein